MNEIKTTAKKLVHMKETYHFILITMALFVAYQAFIVVPQKNTQKKIEAERAEFLAKEIKYKWCISDAEENYNNIWESNCKDFGINSKGSNCLLPGRIADDLGETLDNDKKACLARYK